jgi:hypothetical protein
MGHRAIAPSETLRKLSQCRQGCDDFEAPDHYQRIKAGRLVLRKRPFSENLVSHEALMLVEAAVQLQQLRFHQEGLFTARGFLIGATPIGFHFASELVQIHVEAMLSKWTA